MENVSSLIVALFVVTTIVTVWLFYKASGSNRKVFYVLLPWAGFTGILGWSGFYQVVGKMPPRFVFLIGPGFLFIFSLFLSPKGKAFIDTLDIKWLTILHIVRLPVELVLYAIFLSGLIPVHMTFEGYNFDIIAGITAPIVYYLVLVAKTLDRKFLLLWNVLSLALLVNILTIAILSAQTPLQQLAFDQPNIGVTLFPFVWLPAIVVPIVLISQLAGIRQLTLAKPVEKIGQPA